MNQHNVSFKTASVADRKNYILGRLALAKYVQIIHTLFIKQKRKYDLIIGPGDSGVMMIYFLRLIARQFHIQLPRQVAIPIFRYTTKFPLVHRYQDELFDNNVLIPWLKKKIRRIRKISQVLFIDDEVYQGRSLESCIALIKQAARPGQLSRTLTCDVVADDHGFRNIQHVPGTTFRFYPLGREKRGYNNVMLFSIPRVFIRPIEAQYISKNDCRQERINLLLGLPIKMMSRGRPVYSRRPFIRLKKRIKRYRSIRLAAIRYLQRSIQRIARV